MLIALASMLLTAANPQQVAPAPAAEPPAAGPTIHVQGNRRKWDPQRIVCKDLEQPGSRLSNKRVCRSMLEWASTKREDQQLLIEKQYNGAK